VALAPLDIGASSISDLAYSATNNQLYAVYSFANSKSAYLASVGPSTMETITLPANFDIGQGVVSTVDDPTNMYYIAVSTGASYSIATINQANMSQIIRQVVINPKTCPNAVPAYLMYDSASGMLIGPVITSFDRQYFYYGFAKISPTTGNCTVTNMNLVGLVGGWGYDPTVKTLWLIVGGIGFSYLQAYTIATNTLGPIISMSEQAAPTSLELSLNF